MSYPSCVKCQKEIGDSDAIELDSEGNKVIHESCFSCDHCSKTLLDEEYIQNGDMLLHSECHKELYTPKCAVCKEFIEEEYIEHDSKILHSNCFRCIFCQVSIGENKFYNGDEGIHCHHCFLQKVHTCYACNQKITNEALSAVDHFWHKTCFVCFLCKNELHGSPFVSINEEHLHENCYSQLYFKNCNYCKGKIHVKYCQQEDDCFYHLECVEKKNKDQKITKEDLKREIESAIEVKTKMDAIREEISLKQAEEEELRRRRAVDLTERKKENKRQKELEENLKQNMEAIEKERAELMELKKNGGVDKVKLINKVKGLQDLMQKDAQLRNEYNAILKAEEDQEERERDFATKMARKEEEGAIMKQMQAEMDKLKAEEEFLRGKITSQMKQIKEEEETKKNVE